jgi:hypothetical protein
VAGQNQTGTNFAAAANSWAIVFRASLSAGQPIT